MPNIILLSGDGIGPEIMAEADRVLDRVNEQHGLGISTESCLIGGAAIDATGEPLPDETLKKSQECRCRAIGRCGWSEVG